MTRSRKLGACTWLFGDRPLGEIARRVKALGFDGVELMGDLTRSSATEAARVLREEGLEVLSITPADVDLAHPDANVRAGAVDYFLRLLDFCAEIDRPLVGCHGLVGRVRAISTQAEERAVFLEAVRQIAARARPMGLRLVMEVLNRYEAHLLNTAAEAVQFVTDVGAENVDILLDAYHMNIEEANPADAIRQAGKHLGLYHVADSNRQGVGRGHTDFGAQAAALHEIGYTGPVIVECTAPGPDPFTPIKGDDSLFWLETFLLESHEWLSGAV